MSPPSGAAPADETTPPHAQRGTEAETAADIGAAWAHATALAIWDRLAARDYAGWDPYDALNARFLPSAVKNARISRRALTQAVKRATVPLQPLLGVPQGVDAYTLGHVLLTAARLSIAAGTATDAPAVPVDPPTSAALGEPLDLSAAVRRVVAQLRAMAYRDGDRLAWGYHFPVHTRFFSYAPPTPNLIVTAFVAKGLAAVTRAGLADCSAEVRGAASFVLEGLPRVTDDTGRCVGYVPGETAVIHNANMLAALVLCEAAGTVGAYAAPVAPGAPTAVAPAVAAPPDASAAAWLDAALACARFTAARQAPDGSWPYSEEPQGRWVDGFHTGFVLEGLAAVVRATGDPALRAALERGVTYYVAQLFSPSGEPKYYPDRPRPYDALAAAQGVEVLHVALGADGARNAGGALMPGAAHAVPGQIAWIRERLVRSAGAGRRGGASRGRVAYQVHRYWTDRREFPRWSSAPLMSALAGVNAVPAVGGGAAANHGAQADRSAAAAALPKDGAV